MTVRVGEWAGIDTVLTMMSHAGFTAGGEIERVPSLYIGSFGASVLDLANAYSVFANGGERYVPYYISRILDRDGNTLYEVEPVHYQVVSPGAAWLTSNVLRRVVEEGGTAASLREIGFAYPAGGKTGTTNDFHDAWYAGYTSRLSAAVWVGLDQPAAIAPGAYGGRISLPIWSEVMTRAAEFGYPFTEFAPPGDVLPVDVCRISGKLPRPECHRIGCVYEERLPADLIPRDFCPLHGE